MIKPRSALGLILSGLLVLTACSTGSKNNSKESDDSLVFGVRNDIDTFDPNVSTQLDGALQSFRALYATLVNIPAAGPNEGDIQGLVAESWKWVDPSTLKLKVRSDLTCSDGSPFTPEGIAESVRRVGDPDHGSQFASRIFGPDGLKNVTGDDAESTVTIETNRPYADLLVGLNEAYLVCPAAIGKDKKIATDPPATGPYSLTKQERGNAYTLTRRPAYSALPDGQSIDKLPKEIVLRVVTNDTTRANLVLSGELDVTSILGRDAARVKANKQLTTFDGPGFGSDALLFNQKKGLPGADRNVREALAMAVDTRAYTKAATFGLGKPVTTMYTPNMSCFTEANGTHTPAFDPKGAEAKLEAAGYVRNGDGIFEKDGRPLVIRLAGFDGQNDGPGYLASALRDIGVDVRVTNGSFEQLLNIWFGTGKWDVGVFPYNSPFYTPALLVNQVTGPPTGLNVGDIQNSSYISHSAKALTAAPDADNCTDWQQAEVALLKNVDVKPLVWSKAMWVTHGTVAPGNYYYLDTNKVGVR